MAAVTDADAAVFLPDDIIYYIVTLLPAKPLQRFRCVSKCWNHILTRPDFMKLRSRKTLILPFRHDHAIHLIDTTTTSSNPAHRCFPPHIRTGPVIVVGSFNGIVLLCNGHGPTVFTLYNPFTGEFKNLLQQPPHRGIASAYGFGYGANKRDLKIVKFTAHLRTADVYSFQDSSWSTRDYKFGNKFEHDVGHFVNGSLYWIEHRFCPELLVFRLKDMVRSYIRLPYDKVFIKRGQLNPNDRLGKMKGCLCSLHQISYGGFDVWVMKKRGKWSKLYSLELLPAAGFNNIAAGLPSYYPLCILDSRRILFVDPCENLIMYDTLTKSFKTFEDFSMKGVRVNAKACVESLVSPTRLIKRMQNSMVETRR